MAILKKLPARPMVIVFLCFLIFESIYFPIQSKKADDTMCCFGDGQTVELSGILFKKEEKSEEYRYYLTHLSISDLAYPGKAILSTGSDDYPTGTKLKIIATVREPSRAQNQGGFDEMTYLKGQGIRLCVKRFTVLSAERTGLYWLLFPMETLKEKITQLYGEFLPGEEGGILSAMTLGEKSRMDEEAGQLFREAGLSHILAVSGLHVSIVGMGLFRFLKRLGMRDKACCVLASLSVVLYGVLTGLSVSTFRSVLMFLILMFSHVTGEGYDLLSAWMLALMIVLLTEPMAPLNSGCVFSFGAVLGIALVADPITKQYESICRKRYEKTLRYRLGKPYRKSAKERMVSAVLFALGVQLFTIPVVAYFYYEIPIYVVGLNLMVIPLLTLVVGVGLLGGVIGVILPCFMGLSRTLLYFCHLFLYFYEAASDASLHLPFAKALTGRPSVIRIVLYYGILLGFVYGRSLWNKLVKEMARTMIEPRLSETLKYIFGVGALSLFLLALILIRLPKGDRIDMLSVGQGDGISFFSREGVTFMIDGGSSSQKDVGKYVLKPFLSYHGRSRVDYWFLTHMDSDHISGCAELLEDGFAIKNLVLPMAIQREQDREELEHYHMLLDLCERNHTRVLYMKKGDVCGSGSLTFSCLYPDMPPCYSGANENSLVLKVSDGSFDMICTGDIGEEQERVILSDHVLPSDVEVLKAAHHGSNGSNCREWLSALSPKLCIISAGKNNHYGHPGREALERMDALDITHICTMDRGQISIYPKKNGSFAIKTYF
ncbi:MAG: DNA internalization-related competence protein ComEC/Rec2 [Lachnospiraceae bacterium]|nr:DNA internalization-related competence protein ComEC/Rec2 [Lachnospiraceae bacterium]